ncbi:MAG: hypothetical protein K9H61_03080 [Bacteroidia bacterium]|nr:hypothetical protein [Bacteroidia bacterium]MCF8445956.1 hypothetical protein [Bacteroidia bacterium]
MFREISTSFLIEVLYKKPYSLGSKLDTITGIFFLGSNRTKKVNIFLRRALLPIFLFLLSHLSLYGQVLIQVLNNDPFRMEPDYFSYLKIEYNHQEILLNKIKSVETKLYKLSKSGRSKGFGKLEYKLDFNKAGNPIYFHRKDDIGSRWFNLIYPIRYRYDYYFLYDSLNRLSSIKELINRSNQLENETDIFYSYDTKGRVNKVVYSKKDICRRRFNFSGIACSNDTNMVETTLNYSGFILTWLFQKNYDSHYSWLRLDSAFVNTTFDSLFVPKLYTKGVITDSSGNTIQVDLNKGLGSCTGGISNNNSTQVEFIFKYQNNQHNKLVNVKKFDAENKLVNTRIFNYDKNGLFSSKESINLFSKRNTIQIYKYVFY